MPNEIDRSIVGLGFDNAQFESAAAKSMGTLAKLKESLSFKGSEAGATKIQKAFSNITFGTLNNGLNTVTKSFSLLEQIGIGAARRLGASIEQLGEKMINKLGMEQIRTGWSKYGEITQSIQTMVAATGKSIDEITTYMNKLNWFSDETSYSLTDMTSNIAKFTSAGIDLEDAVDQMMGIGAAAALAGSGVQNASHAMAGFSKAMAAGYMSTINWNWIQTSRMDTLAFKQALIDAAVEVGTLKKRGDKFFAGGMEVKAENMRETLSKKWLNTEAMEKALSVYGKFSTALNEFYELVGNGNYYTTSDLLEYIDALSKGEDITSRIQKMAKVTGISVEELTDKLTELGSSTYDTGRKAFAAAQEAITAKQAWDALADAVSTGWMKTFQLIFGNYEEAKKLWTDLANFLYELFAEGGFTRNELLEEWHFTTSGGYQDFIAGISNMMDAIISLRDIIRETFGDLLPNINVNSLTTVTDKFKKFTDDLTTSINAFKKLIGISDEVEENVEEIDTSVSGETVQLVEESTENTENKISEIANRVKKLLPGNLSFSLIRELFANNGIYSIDPEYTDAYREELLRKHKKDNLPDLLQETLFGTEGTAELPKFHRRWKEIADGFIEILPSDLTRGITGSWFGNFDSSRFSSRNTRSIDKTTSPKFIQESLFEPGTTEEIVEDTDKITKRYENLWDILKGIKSTGTIIKNTVELAWGAIKTAFAPVKTLGDDFLELFAAIGRRITKISEDLVGNGSMLRFFRDLGTDGSSFIEKVVEGIRKLINALTDLVDPEVESSSSEFLNTLMEVFGGLWGGIKTIFNTVAPMISSIIKLLTSLFSGLGDILQGFFGNIDWNNFDIKLKGLLDIGILGFIASIAKKINDVVKKFKGKGIKDIITQLIYGDSDDNKEDAGEGGSGGIKGIFKNIKSKLNDFGEGLKSFADKVSESMKKFVDAQMLKEFAKAILEIAVSMLIIAMIPKDKLLQSLGVMATLIGAIIGMFYLFSKINMKQAASIAAFGTAMAGIGTGILMLAAAMFVLALIPSNKITDRLFAIGGMLTALVAVLGIVSNFNAGRMLAAGVSIMLMSAAIDLIAVALVALAFIPVDNLTNRLFAITGMLMGLVVAIGVLSKCNIAGMLAAGVAIVLVSAALDMVAVALVALAFIPAEKLIFGVLGLITVITAISTALALLGSGNVLGMLGGAMAMLILAPAVVLLAGALTILSLVPFAGLVGGLVILGAALAGIVIAAYMITPVIPALLALSVSFVTISLSTALLTVEILALSAAVAVVVLAVAGGITMVLGALTELVYAIKGTVKESGDQAEEGGKAISTNLLDGLKNAFSESISGVVQNMFDGLKSKWQAFKQKLKDIGASIWNWMKGGLEKESGIASPSKEMAKEMGYLIAGLDMGVDKNVSTLKGIGSGLASALLDSTSDGLSEFDGLSPYLSPVLDMSGVSSPGDLSFGATLTPSAVRSLGSVSADIRDQRESMNDYIDTAVQSAINGMKDQLTFVVPLEVDGYQFAKSTAKFTRDAQNLLDRNTLRKGGFTS